MSEPDRAIQYRKDVRPNKQQTRRLPGLLFVARLSAIRCDGEGGVAVIEGDVHALAGREAGQPEPYIGDLHSGMNGADGPSC